MTRRCLSLLLFFCCGAYAVSAAAKATPSFDCAKAKNEAERLICADEDLAKLDVEMNEWYKKAIRWQLLIEGTNTRFEVSCQNKWQARRNKFECRPKVANKKECLISLYQEAMQVWKNRLLRFEIGRACPHYDDPVSACNFKYVDYLLKQGADINGYDRFYGYCGINGPVYFKAMWTSNWPTFNYVIEKGADFQKPLRDDCIPRHALDHTGAFKFMDEIMELDPKADLNKWSYFEYLIPRALGTWVKNFEPYRDYIEKFFHYGADINITSETGDNLLIFIFNYNLFPGDFQFDYERTLSMIKYLIAQGIDISHKNNEGHDALYYLQNSPCTIDKNYYEKFEELLSSNNKGVKSD